MTKESVYKTAGMVMVITIIYRVLGFLREMQIASYLGVGSRADAYYVAFSIPNIIIEILALGAMTSAIIPVASKYMVTKEYGKLNTIGNNVSSIVLVVSLIATLICTLFSKEIVTILAPGLDSSSSALATKLTIIMLPSMVLSGLYGVNKAILNTYNHFFIPAFANVVYNFLLIIVAFFGYKYFGIEVFAYAVIIGTVAQCLLQNIKLKDYNYKFSFKIDTKNTDLRNIFKLMIPIVIASIIAQLNFIVDKAVASNLKGGISTLNYANKLVQLPIGIFVGAVVTTMLPSLSRCAQSKDKVQFDNLLNKAFNMLLIFLVPSTIILMTLNIPIINVLFQVKAFTFSDTIATSSVLFYYTIGLSFLAISQLFISAFYANQNTKTTLFVNSASVALNIVLNLVLSKLMQTKGIALATSVSSIFSFFIFYYLLNKRFGFKLNSKIREYLKMVVAVVFMFISCKVFSVTYIKYFIHIPRIERFGLIFVGVLVVFVVYFWILSILKFEGISSVKQFIRKKFLKKA